MDYILNESITQYFIKKKSNLIRYMLNQYTNSNKLNVIKFDEMISAQYIYYIIYLKFIFNIFKLFKIYIYI